MATKKVKKGKTTPKPAKKIAAKKAVTAKPEQKEKLKVKGKRVKPPKGCKIIKCCSHCPDYEYCDDRGLCCDYCDFYLNGACTHGKKKGIPSLDEQVELPDYRGDDYGIDDYEAYEPVYE
jgi:hypothetical protein